jgi:hypothetical protein
MADPYPTPSSQPPPPPPPPRRGRRGCLIPLAIVGGLIVILGLILVVSGGGSDDDDSDGGDDDGVTQFEEVTVTQCGPPDAIGVVYVRGEASNTSSERSMYTIEVAVEDPNGDQIGTGTTFVENVEPGQSAAWDALTDAGDRWVDGATCRVVDVERDAAL